MANSEDGTIDFKDLISRYKFLRKDSDSELRSVEGVASAKPVERLMDEFWKHIYRVDRVIDPLT